MIMTAAESLSEYMSRCDLYTCSLNGALPINASYLPSRHGAELSRLTSGRVVQLIWFTQTKRDYKQR